MSRRHDTDSPSTAIGDRQRQVLEEEFREGVRALLMTPLLSPQHESFATIYRHSEALREWFLRETGWMLEVERGGARLFKRPADLLSAVRGLDGYDRRRYVLLCLACAVLERADAQITLRLLGEKLLQLAAEPELAALDFSFTLGTQQERRELISVCRTFLDLGVLARVAGEEEAFVQAGESTPMRSMTSIAGRLRACWRACADRQAGRRRIRRSRSTTGCEPWSRSMSRTATKGGARRCATISPAASWTIP